MRKYGRKIPSPLPAHRMLERAGATVPMVVDLRQWGGPIKDQGDEGSCTAHAGTSACELIFRKYFKKSPVFSPQYTYAKELIMQGDFPRDEGSEGVTLCNVLIANGCCELSLYPYISEQILMPTAEQDKNAAQFKMGAYHGLIGSHTAISVLGDSTPWPVEVGFTVYESFEGEQIAKTGIMPVPTKSESVLGGHEVLAVGYDIGLAETIRPKGCPPAVLIQNSWGGGWGVGGYFWMPLEILDRSDTDLKIVHSGHPWKRSSLLY